MFSFAFYSFLGVSIKSSQVENHHRDFNYKNSALKKKNKPKNSVELFAIRDQILNLGIPLSISVSALYCQYLTFISSLMLHFLRSRALYYFSCGVWKREGQLGIIP